MKRQSIYIRAGIALVLVPAITAYCAWLIQSSAKARFRSSTPGQIVRLYDQVAPQVEQHNQEIEELAQPWERPAGGK